MKTLALLVPIVFALGCSKKESPPPASFRYTLTTTDPTLLGLAVSIAGQRTAFAADPLQPQATEIRAGADVPSSAASVLDLLSVELPTPCGTRTLTLRATQTPAEEQAQRKQRPFVNLTVLPSAKVDVPVPVWVDGAPATLGTLELKQGKNLVYDRACKAGLEFRAGATVLGTMPQVEPNAAADPRAKRAVFVTTLEKCYAFRGVLYDNNPTGGSGRPESLANAHVYPLSDSVDHFLTEAPKVKTGGPAMQYELVAVSCP